MSNIIEIENWLKQKDKSNAGFDGSTDLIDEGLVDSLIFVEFILMIEEYAETEITINDDIIEKVRTLNNVKHNFFSQKPHKRTLS